MPAYMPNAHLSLSPFYIVHCTTLPVGSSIEFFPQASGRQRGKAVVLYCGLRDQLNIRNKSQFSNRYLRS